MAGDKQTMAQQVAQVVREFQRQRTGNAPKSVTIVLGENTLVVTLHDALSPAEKALAKTPEGAAQVQDYHRKLFATSSEDLLAEIKRITGVAVREAAAEVEIDTGNVVHAFTSGTMVQVFMMTDKISSEEWHGPRKGDGQAT